MTFEQFNNTDTIRIVVEVSNICNFKCSYCQISKNSEEPVFVDLKVFANNLKKKILKLRKNTIIDITGNSEPTLHPQLFSFCQSLQEEIYISKILICTNLTCDIQSVRQFISMDKVQFVPTIHLNQLKQKDISLILSKLGILAKNNKLDSCIVMLEPNKVNESFELFKQLCRYLPNQHIQIELCLPISLYTNNDLTKIKKISYDFNTNICDYDCINSKILCYIKYDMSIYMCYALRYKNNISSNIRFSNSMSLIDLFKMPEYINQCNI